MATHRITAAVAGIVGAAVAALAGGPPSAVAQTWPTNPYAFTCAELLASDTPEARQEANLVVYWAIGYLDGRLGNDADGRPGSLYFSSNVLDVTTALRETCPSVPDMPIAELTIKLAEDRQGTLDSSP